MTETKKKDIFIIFLSLNLTLPDKVDKDVPLVCKSIVTLFPKLKLLLLNTIYFIL